VAKHLLDETAEFRMPRIPRHAADNVAEFEDEFGDGFEATQRFDPGFRQQPPASVQDPNAR
jgi:hypothetical protein